MAVIRRVCADPEAHGAEEAQDTHRIVPAAAGVPHGLPSAQRIWGLDLRGRRSFVGAGFCSGSRVFLHCYLS